MPSYIAKFSDGYKKQLLKSVRNYAAAWRITVRFIDFQGTEQTVSRSGFARDRELAASAMMKESRGDRTGMGIAGRKYHEQGTIVFQEVIDVKAA